MMEYIQVYRIEKEGFGPFFRLKIDTGKNAFPFKKDIYSLTEYPHPLESKDDDFRIFFEETIQGLFFADRRKYFFGASSLEGLLKYFDMTVEEILATGYEIKVYEASEAIVDKFDGAVIFNKETVRKVENYVG